MMFGGWWFADRLQHDGPVIAVGWVVWVIGSVVLHELAHGWAAIGLGDDTPVRTGHMTWNPMVHMGPMSLIALAVVGIAWGLMPINPARLRGRYGNAWVSLAGPAMNLLLAAGALVLCVLWVGLAGAHWTSWKAPEPLFTNTKEFLWLGIALNLLLAIFNMLPVPPLDGSRILGSFHPPFARVWEHEQAQFVALALFLGVFFLGGPVIFGLAFDAANHLLLSALRTFVPGAV